MFWLITLNEMESHQRNMIQIYKNLYEMLRIKK